ncbi:hypothetical protein, partial [Gordonia rhizosphera]
VDAAVTVYGEHVERQTLERSEAAIAAIDRVLSKPQTSDKAQLREQRQTLEVQATDPSGVQVVQASTVNLSSGAPSWALGAVAGGLIGGIIFLSAGLAWRRRAGIVSAPSALDPLLADGSVSQILLPVVKPDQAAGHEQRTIQTARTLYAQLAAPRTGLILVVGASENSGSQAIADLIASAAAEHGTIQRDQLRSTEVADAPQDNAVIRVVDGDTLSTSPGLPDAAALADHIVVVARIGVDDIGSVKAAAGLARGIRPVVVCIKRPISRPNLETANLGSLDAHLERSPEKPRPTEPAR